MEAEQGANFLLLILFDGCYPMDGSDLEEAIRVAGEQSVKRAFKDAQQHYKLRHGSSDLNGSLGFAKGIRWLAMIRRDEGTVAFDGKVSALYNARGICPHCRQECVVVSIASCTTCRKKGCNKCLAGSISQDGIVRWHTRCQML